jgi:hypothetical protein
MMGKVRKQIYDMYFQEEFFSIDGRGRDQWVAWRRMTVAR